MANPSRVDIIVIILFAVIGLMIPAVVIIRHFFGMDPLTLLHIHWGRTAAGILFTILATAVCLLNFYLTLLVPWLHRRRHGSMAGFAGMSGLPAFGDVFIFGAGALMPQSVPLGIYLLVLYCINGNGLPWFFVSIIRNGV